MTDVSDSMLASVCYQLLSRLAAWRQTYVNRISKTDRFRGLRSMAETKEFTTGTCSTEILKVLPTALPGVQTATRVVRVAASYCQGGHRGTPKRVQVHFRATNYLLPSGLPDLLALDVLSYNMFVGRSCEASPHHRM